MGVRNRGRRQRKEATKQEQVDASQQSSEWEAEAMLANQKDHSPLPLRFSTAVVFTVVLAVYGYTASPSITGGDSGELVITTCNLGVAHPPGYPLFTMLGYLFNHLIPVGHKAWRINMMSSIMGATGAGMVHIAVALLIGDVWPALWAAFAFAFNPTVWLYSTQGEVFGLNNMLVAAMAMMTVVFYRKLHVPAHIRQSADKGNPAAVRAACLGAFVSGLAMTNQHTTVFYVAPTVLFVTWGMWGQHLINWRVTGLLTASLVAGMSPYVYLPLRAGTEDSWGDQTTLGGFMHHFLRAEYGTFQLAADSISEDPGMASRMAVYWQTLLRESNYVTPFLAILGAVCGLRSKSTVMQSSSYVFVASYVLYVLVFHYLANLDLNPLFLGVQARFWQQANLYVCVFAGIGLHYAAGWLLASVRRRKLVIMSLVVALSGLQCGMHWYTNNHHGEYGFYNHGEIVLKGFPKRSIVLLNGDLNNNLIKYPQQCEGVRPDLRLLSLQLMTWEWFVPMQASYYRGVSFPGDRYHPRTPGGFSLKQFLDANHDSFNLFLCGPFKEGDSSHEGHYEELPFGICSQLVKTGSSPERMQRFLAKSWAATPKLEDLGTWSDKFGDETWERVLFSDAYKRLIYLHSYTSFQSNQKPKSRKLRELAYNITDYIFTEHVEELEAHDMLSAASYRSGGIIYGQYTKQLWDELSEEEPEERERQVNEVEKRMFALWDKCVELEPENNEISMFVNTRNNPYLRR